MTTETLPDPYARLNADVLTIQRRLRGPIERVWSYLTESDLRRRWLAAGEMTMQPDAPFELVWRNAELSDPPGQRPEGFGEEHRMKGRIIACDPPRKLVFSWGEKGEVSFDLEPRGNDVVLTLIHRRFPDRNAQLNVSAGWHAHLDVLAARIAGEETAKPFWEAWSGLKREYEKRIAD